MTPKQAIKAECGVCNGKKACTSKHCALNGSGRALERIRQHCMDCSPNHRVEDCNGQIIGTQAQALNALYQIPVIDGKAECPLYPYRAGTDPNRKKRTLPNHLKPYLYPRKPQQEDVSGAEFESIEAEPVLT